MPSYSVFYLQLSVKTPFISVYLPLLLRISINVSKKLPIQAHHPPKFPAKVSLKLRTFARHYLLTPHLFIFPFREPEVSRGGEVRAQGDHGEGSNPEIQLGKPGQKLRRVGSLLLIPEKHLERWRFSRGTRAGKLRSRFPRTCVSRLLVVAASWWGASSMANGFADCFERRPRLGSVEETVPASDLLSRNV